MKKRNFLFGVFVVWLVLAASFSLAAENETAKVADAYNCLEKKIENKCDSISYEEKIFSLLAVRKCRNELLEDSVDEECFPKSGCKVKATAQAILALDKVGADTAKAEEWITKQNKTPTDVIWYLQIDSSEATICTISYESSEYAFYVGANKKINQGGGCFSLGRGGYWLEISQACYGKEFEISCDKDFLTNLLFKKRDSSKVYISGTTNTASSEGRTTEKVDSFCFTESGSCDYEASLWATLVLDYLGYETSSYMPYIITMSEGNSRFLPEAFLYMLTDDTDYRIDLLEKQKGSYWEESGDKFYDTAVALYPFQYEEPSEKTDSKDWLLETQDNQGCWKGNIKNTAFILHSVWPKVFGAPEEVEDCEIDMDGFCISSIACEEAGGDELYSYSSTCTGSNVCCNRDKVLESCEDLNGKECAGSETCSTSTVEASDTDECCPGYCREVVEKTDCEKYGGICRGSCTESEQETVDECDSGEVCCIEKTEEEKSYLWIWILLILIVLVLIGIISRDKLRPFWFRLTSKFKKTPPRGPPRRGFPSPFMRRMPRRIIPRHAPSKPQARPPVKTAPKKKSSSELDDVLKKLRDIGK
ncbi:MAG: hypothetical protein PVJ67_00500 [Candidatus Pacearchaeota archaeon]|jgi:hypothetical protein